MIKTYIQCDEPGCLTQILVPDGPPGILPEGWSLITVHEKRQPCEADVRYGSSNIISFLYHACKTHRKTLVQCYMNENRSFTVESRP